jgi:hypothetical protein
MAECTYCGEYEVVLDEKAGHMVCDWVISQESVVAHDYERNKDYHAEHYVLPTAEIPGHKLQMLDGSLREVELKSKRKGSERLDQPLETTRRRRISHGRLGVRGRLHRSLSGKNYLRMKKDIILLHVLGAVLLMSRGLQQPR